MRRDERLKLMLESMEAIADMRLDPVGLLPMCTSPRACEGCPCSRLFDSGVGDDECCVFADEDEALIAIGFGIAALEEEMDG